MTDPEPTPPSQPQPASFVRVVGAVLSAFVGIRKRQSADPLVIKPAHIVAAGVLCALLFIATLVTLVRFIIAR